MKKSINLILKELPMLEEHLNDKGVKLEEMDLLQQTFLKLLRFYENPKENSFDIKILYGNLSDEWLELALRSINTFFTFDTYLIKDKKDNVNKSHEHTPFYDDNNYYTQKNFVDFLNENNVSYSEAKMSTYINRGKIPKPDLLISGKRFWKKETCELFLEEFK